MSFVGGKHARYFGSVALTGEHIGGHSFNLVGAHLPAATESVTRRAARAGSPRGAGGGGLKWAPDRARTSPRAPRQGSGRIGEPASSAARSRPARRGLLRDDDLHLFNEGTHRRLWERFGAHPSGDGEGVHFAVWAPDAARVSVVGDFNAWTPGAEPLTPRGDSGVWEGFAPGARVGALYKYFVESRRNDHRAWKADPVGFFSEQPPGHASIVCDLGAYTWGDGEWMATRAGRNALDKPVSIYEVHLGSWRRDPARPHEPLTYRALAPLLAEHCERMGFTHVEILPLTEHPFYGSWGYQTTGYFAATSRYGTPQDLMFLIDTLHRRGIGVILDWTPSHFCADDHGLAFFDGAHAYEHADPRRGYHPDWNSAIFNYGRREVRSFLISSAVFWASVFHADGLRVDGVASMLYNDYSRRDGEWIPNEHGGRENLEAISLLREVTSAVRAEAPGVLVIAEESTAWPGVTAPTERQGLGFSLKWDMGWMHDTLRYFSRDPVHRKHHQNDVTFRALYMDSERFLLPLSHDEVVYGKGSLLGRMPGDWWQKFANLRALHALMHAQPGKKLLFMGGEFGQWSEWRHDQSLDWHLVEGEMGAMHRGVERLVAALNRLHRSCAALHELDCAPGGFEWIDCADHGQSVLAFVRRGRDPGDETLVVCNLTPVPRRNYRVGAPSAGMWRAVLNTDDEEFGGSGCFPVGRVCALSVPAHGREKSIEVDLPPLAVVFLERERGASKGAGRVGA